MTTKYLLMAGLERLQERGRKDVPCIDYFKVVHEFFPRGLEVLRDYLEKNVSLQELGLVFDLNVFQRRDYQKRILGHNVFAFSYGIKKNKDLLKEKGYGRVLFT